MSASNLFFSGFSQNKIKLYLAKPKYIRRLSTAIAVLLALPLPWGILTGFYIWFSPFVMLNSVFLLKSMVLFNVFGWVVLLISFFRNRWFCRYLCPVGLGCDTFSRWGRSKVSNVKKIPPLGKWLTLISLGAALTGIPLFIYLDPIAIFNGFFAAFSTSPSFTVFVSLSGLPLLFLSHLIFPGMWCGKLCPLGGLFDELTTLRKWIVKTFVKRKVIRTGSNFTRRTFLALGSGLVSGLFVPRLLPSKTARIFRPPASINEELFNILCVRCGNCIKACPTNILRHNLQTTNAVSWMTPELTFQDNGYCLEDCTRCGDVCPTGSISPFTVEAKKQLYIGSIEIGLEKCLLTDNKECDRCKTVCSYRAIEIVPSDTSLITKPVADLKKCVGCGACAAVCPSETIQMVFPG